MAWVYILECADGSYYVGSTTDLDRRVWEHNEGVGAAYTKRRRPVRLVWSTYYPRVDQAFAFEKQVQRWGRAKRQALIEGRIDDLSMLGSRSEVARAIKDGAELGRPFGPIGTTDPPAVVAGPDERDAPDGPDDSEDPEGPDDPWSPPAPWVS